MIYDCFTFFNEFHLLEARFRLYNQMVDRFVITEADRTFTGKPRQWAFEALDDLPPMLQPWKHQIILNHVTIPEEYTDPWDVEVYQRNHMIPDGVRVDDVVILSDVDEFVHPLVIADFLCWDDGDILQAKVDQYFWNLNWKVPDHCNEGGRPVVALYKADLVPQEARTSNEIHQRLGAGWHLSFFGHAGTDKLKEKVEAYAHTEMDRPEFKDRDLAYLRQAWGIDPFDRFPLERVDAPEELADLF